MLQKNNVGASDSWGSGSCKHQFQQCHYSHIVWLVQHCQSWPCFPNTATSNTTGSISIAAICSKAKDAHHCTWNHWWWDKKASQPMHLMHRTSLPLMGHWGLVSSGHSSYPDNIATTAIPFAPDCPSKWNDWDDFQSWRHQWGFARKHAAQISCIILYWFQP